MLSAKYPFLSFFFFLILAAPCGMEDLSFSARD